ncbi:unnamed protein product, partial [marine sediment metagenome]
MKIIDALKTKIQDNNDKIQDNSNKIQSIQTSLKMLNTSVRKLEMRFKRKDIPRLPKCDFCGRVVKDTEAKICVDCGNPLSETMLREKDYM